MPIILIILAAMLEVVGDALVRRGLRGANLWALAAGAGLLIAYGVAVNLTQWSFGRLLGVYMAAFFLIAQLTAALFFHEYPTRSILVGGILILAGGFVIFAWQPK